MELVEGYGTKCLKKGHWKFCSYIELACKDTQEDPTNTEN